MKKYLQISIFSELNLFWLNVNFPSGSKLQFLLLIPILVYSLILESQNQTKNIPMVLALGFPLFWDKISILEMEFSGNVLRKVEWKPEYLWFT